MYRMNAVDQNGAVVMTKGKKRWKKVLLLLIVIALTALIVVIMLNNTFHWWTTLPWQEGNIENELQITSDI